MSDKGIKVHERDIYVNLGKNKSAIRDYKDVDSARFNSLEVAVTNITANTIAQINTPDNCNNFVVMHKELNKFLYVGDDAVSINSGFPLNAGESLKLEHMQKGNSNEIYAFCDQDIKVYCIGVAKI